jgi:hypothetical protein
MKKGGLEVRHRWNPPNQLRTMRLGAAQCGRGNFTLRIRCIQPKLSPTLRFVYTVLPHFCYYAVSVCCSGRENLQLWQSMGELNDPKVLVVRTIKSCAC